MASSHCPNQCCFIANKTRWNKSQLNIYLRFKQFLTWKYVWNVVCKWRLFCIGLSISEYVDSGWQMYTLKSVKWTYVINAAITLPVMNTFWRINIRGPAKDFFLLFFQFVIIRKRSQFSRYNEMISCSSKDFILLWRKDSWLFSI